MDVYTIPSLLLEHSAVMTLLPFLSLDQWFSTGSDFVPGRHLAMFGDLFGW